MRRRGRWLLHALTVLSLLMCAAIVIVGVTSGNLAWVLWYGGASSHAELLDGQRITTYDSYRQSFIMVAKGCRVSGRLERQDDNERDDAFHWVLYHETVADEALISLARYPMGDHLLPRPNRSGRDVGAIEWSVPLGVPLAATAVLPLLVGVARRKRRKVRGRCESCSYDLTGNVSGVCPECGAEVTAGATT